MEQSLPAPDNILYPLLLWIPAVPVLYLLISLFRRINRDEYGKSEDTETGKNEFGIDL